MIAALFSVLLLASASSVAAETPSPSTEASTAAPVKKAEKVRKICKEDPAYTGSRMPKKLCLTQVEWEKRESGRSAGDLKTIGAH